MYESELIPLRGNKRFNVARVDFVGIEFLIWL